MDCRIELIFVPVTDVDRARDFYVDQVGFTLDHDVRVDESTRFVQLTPVGSACSIAFGEGIHEGTPGTQDTIQVVVDDAESARAQLVANGVEVAEIQDLPWGRFTTFADPDGNRWTVQELPAR
jgi:predicted enzyme related to lactoylglutathione lyase